MAIQNHTKLSQSKSKFKTKWKKNKNKNQNSTENKLCFKIEWNSAEWIGGHLKSINHNIIGYKYIILYISCMRWPFFLWER